MNRIIAILLFGFSLSGYGQFRKTIIEESDSILLNPVMEINFHKQNIYALVRNGGVSYISLDSGSTWQNKNISVEEFPDAIFLESDLISTKKGDLIMATIMDTSKTQKPNLIVCHQYNYKDEYWEELGYFGDEEGNTFYSLDLGYDRNTGNLYTIWTCEKSPTEKYEYFSTSSKGGKKWDDPVIINTKNKGGDAILSRPKLTINHEGNILTAWADNNRFYFDRSYDKGKMWLRNDIVVLERTENLTFNFEGIGDINAEPEMAIDLSVSALRGNVYLIWNEFQNGILDILLIKSGSSGDTWSQPLPLDETNNSEILYQPNISVDQGTGIVYVAYFKHNPATKSTDLYLSFSRTGGNKFKEMKISEEPFTHFPVSTNDKLLNLKVLYGIISITYVREMDEKSVIINTIITKDQIEY